MPQLPSSLRQNKLQLSWPTELLRLRGLRASRGFKRQAATLWRLCHALIPFRAPSQKIASGMLLDDYATLQLGSQKAKLSQKARSPLASRLRRCFPWAPAQLLPAGMAKGRRYLGQPVARPSCVACRVGSEIPRAELHGFPSLLKTGQSKPEGRLARPCRLCASAHPSSS